MPQSTSLANTLRWPAPLCARATTSPMLPTMLGIVFVTCATIAAQTPAPVPVAVLEKRAEAAESNLEYEEAIESWNEIITHGDATDEQAFNAHLRAGILQRVLKNDVESRIHFRYVLQRDVDYVLDDRHPPKIRSFFELIRQEVKDSQSAIAPPTPVEPIKNEDGFSFVGPAVLASGGVGIVLGAALGVATTALYLVANDFDTRARAEPVQTTAKSLGESADTLALAGNVTLVATVVALVIGAAVSATSIFFWDFGGDAAE